MHATKSRFTLGLALACAALTLNLAVGAQAQTVTNLANFNFTNGSRPYAGVIQATDGNFYGTTNVGGSGYLDGNVFEVTPSGQLRSIYDFCSQPNCVDGRSPTSAPILGSDGNLYGVTSAGGTGFYGTFYKMTLSGEITTLYSFCETLCLDGYGPNGIMQASDGNFYGTAGFGGAFSEGTLFQLTPAGQFKLLHTFCSVPPNCADGYHPFYPPIQASDGNFYGTAFGGGTSGEPWGGGVLYELTSTGTFEVIYNFCSSNTRYGCEHGTGPMSIVQDAKGDFFGTTDYGGNSDAGIVFEISASTNQLTVLHSFDVTDGEYPIARITLANDGNLYGVKLDDGGDGSGHLFEVTPAGVYTPLYTFGSGSAGDDPSALFQGTDGNFYGTTLYGGHNAYSNGTVFKLSNGLGPLVETVPVAGKVGTSVIVLGNGLTGSSSVTFNGVEAKFTVESDTYIKATVPTGAATGTVAVVTPTGTLNSNPQFVVTK